MIRISPLQWTDLNPSATSFIPKNIKNEDIIKDDILLNNVNINKSKTQTLDNNDWPLMPSTSKDIIKQKVDQNLKTSKKSKSSSPKKPSNLTLEQFIIEKLRNEAENISLNNSKKVLKLKKKNELNETPVNSLDSSAPNRRRGKQREIPKPKKPTTLKKIIIKEKTGLNDESIEENSDKNNENEEKKDNKQLINTEKAENHDLNDINRKILHCRAFREYCFQCLNQEIDNFLVNLLSDLVVFQDRMFSKDPIKAKAKKRLCFGLREVTKYAKVNKVKLLIIAPDIEKIETKGGLDDTLNSLFKIVDINKTPIVFGLTRKGLGITCKKKGFISCIGILNYDGSQENFKQLMSLSESAQNIYNSVFDESKNKLKTYSYDQIEDILSKLPNIPNEFQNFKKILNPNDRRLAKRK